MHSIDLPNTSSTISTLDFVEQRLAHCAVYTKPESNRKYQVLEVSAKYFPIRLWHIKATKCVRLNFVASINIKLQKPTRTFSTFPWLAVRD